MKARMRKRKMKKRKKIIIQFKKKIEKLAKPVPSRIFQIDFKQLLNINSTNLN